MREPRFTVDELPFSQAPVWRLALVLCDTAKFFPCPEAPEYPPDIDFRRRYVEILLRERGL